MSEQNKQKAKQLGQKYQTPCHGVGDCEFEAYQSALEMAEWKDKQPLSQLGGWHDCKSITGLEDGKRYFVRRKKFYLEYDEYTVAIWNSFSQSFVDSEQYEPVEITGWKEIF